MSMPRAVKHINQSRILAELRQHGPLTRAELARNLRMMRSTTGNLVGSLVSEGLLASHAEPVDRHVPRQVGRPGEKFALNAGHAHFVGADVGVDYLQLVVIDLNAEVVASERAEVGAHQTDPADVAALLGTMLPALLARAGLSRGDLRGTCVSVPGLVDPQGDILRAPILRWENAPFQSWLETALGDVGPIVVENDANAFAIAEMHRLRHTETRHGIFLWIDVGVGGGVMIDGKLHQGHNGFAGEIGHMFIATSDVETDAPLRGTLESFIGRKALMAHYRAFGGTGNDMEEMLARADTGDDTARRALDLWATSLARALATLCSVLNPELISIGGPIAPVMHRCEADVAAHLSALMLHDSPMPQIRISPTGPDAAALGCALKLHEQFFEIDETLVFGEVGGR